MKTWLQVVRDHSAGTSMCVIVALMFLASQRNVIKQYIAQIKKEGHIPH